MAENAQDRTPLPGEDRTPRHPLEEREYEGRAADEHHHTNVWMNRHDESEGGHRGGSHEADEGRASSSGGGAGAASGGGESRTDGDSRGEDGYRAGEDRTPRHPLEEREYEGRQGEEHHHTNVWMNRHGEEEGGHRGGSHPEIG